MDISTLVTDRTLADVTARNDKGPYNATDLNRVGEAMKYLSERFYRYGYSAEISPKLDWTIEDIPTVEQMANYIKDLSTLRGVYAVLETTPQVPDDMNKLTYQEANDIEQILVDLDLVVKHIIAAWYYSGDLFSGEV